MCKMKCGKKLVLFSLFAMNLVEQPAPEVEIEQGKLSGIINADGTVLEYIGIPYATVNSSNRFQAPLPPPKWKGVFKANEESSCPQNLGPILGVVGTEDCLKMNVYVPAMAKRPLPVMVYIHGGAFILGSGGKLIYGPDFLVKQDVILVTFNYRLGVLGFLCLGIKEAPGNAGIKDQIAALRWVKKNIASFGGDPDNITLFGESAGGTSASLLLASEVTTGLFNRVIVQSGSSVSNWAVNRRPVWLASLLAKSLGHNTEDPYELYEFFLKTPYKKLIAQKVQKPAELFFDTQLLYLPCIEKPIPGVEPALTDLPFNLLSRNPKNLPIIYGSNSRDGMLIVAEETEESLEARNYNYLFGSDLEFPNETEAFNENKKMTQFYFGKKLISMKEKYTIIELCTQLYFEIPEILEAEVLLNNTRATVYNYIFNYSGGRNFMKHLTGFGKETGACHGDELLYLFNGIIWPFRISKEDQRVIEWMTTIWINFAKYGEPTPPSTDVPIRWVPSKKGDLKFLYIEDELKMGSMPNPIPYQLWRDVYAKYRRKDLKYYF